MTNLPKPVLHEILRKLTEPIGEIVKAGQVALPKEVVYALVCKEAEKLRWHLVLDGNHWLFVDTIQNYRPTFEIIQAWGKVGSWKTGKPTLIDESHLPALVEKAWAR